MATFRTIIDDARVLLNDEVFDSTTVTRYTEAQLLGYARQALVEARRVRPDLFLSNLTAAFPVLSASSVVPMPEEYHVCLTDYIVHRAELRDDEFAVDGRSAGLLQKFKAGLMGV